MKKLFFMLVLVVGFGLSMQAQVTFFDNEEAISMLKEDIATRSVVVADLTAPAESSQAGLEASLLRSATIRGAQNLIPLIEDQGNNQASLDAAFEDTYFSQQYMTPAIVAEAKQTVKNLVSVDK